MEERRRSWAVGELGAFGRSSSENDVGMLTKRGLEEFLPFLQQRPQSPSYRNASIRRSRHSLGVTADRELLTFLEMAKDEDANKSNSLPRASQERPSVAWIGSKEPGDSSLTNARLHRASDGGMDCNYFQLPTSQSDQVEDLDELDTANTDLYNEQESADSDKYRFSVPCTEATGTAPWDLSLEEHELVSGLLKLDLHGSNAMEDPSTVHFEVGAGDLEIPGDSNLYSFGKASAPVPACRTSKESVYKPAHSAKVASHAHDDFESHNESPTSSDLGIKAHGAAFCVSDASDGSLTLDPAEGNNSNSGGNKLNREGGAGTTFMNDLQSGNSAILDTSSSFPNDKEDLGSKPDFLKERPVKSKDAVGPKRNSLKEKSSNSIKSSTSPPNHPRPVRTLNSSENASMRKVVPISRSTKAAAPPSSAKKPEAKPASRDTSGAETKLLRRNSIRGITDPVSKPPYRQSISVEEPKLQRGTATSSSGQFEKEPLQHKGSFKKPSSKPVRYIPKSKNDETKMCRSSVKAQPPADPNKSTVVTSPKTPAPVPSFARNTVASSSRCAKVDLPATSKASTLTRSLSQRLPKMRMTAASDDSNPKENGGSTLKRANSARMIKRNTDSCDLSVKVEPMLREQITTEMSSSLQSKDGNQTTIGKLLNHF